MNFLFDSYPFEKELSFNQLNNANIPQNRNPFTDITQQMNSFLNSKKNQQINLFTKNFNDFSNNKENYCFLKKKSFEITMKNDEDEDIKEQQTKINKIKKYSNNSYKMCNSLINNLDEDEDEENKENLCGNNFQNNKKKKEEISLNQILDDAINEKKELDKNERDKKKANKLKQIKMLLKNRKNNSDYTNRNKDISNKENFNNNIQINNCIGLQGQKSGKELNMMCLD